MEPEQPPTSYSEHDTNTQSDTNCEICGSGESISEYSFSQSAGDRSAILLCPQHYHVAAILSWSRFQDSAISTDYDLQETQKITIRVPKALVESADATAEQQGQTRSEFVRDGIQMAIEIQEMEEAFDDILSQAVQSADSTEAETDVEFLKERIRTLESLLENSIEKI